MSTGGTTPEHAPRVDVSISIVTFRSAACLPGLIADLRAQVGVECEVLVVDNDSRDATCEVLDALGCADVIRNAANVGFGRAHNQNLARARGRYVLLLNPDVRVGAQLCDLLAAYLDAHPDVAIVGPRVLEGPAGCEFAPRRSYPGDGMVPLRVAGSPAEPTWLSGCCLMVRRAVLAELGGFDPAYFLYAEEIDLCLRARRAGHRLGWCPEVEVHHLQHQSQPGVDAEERARRLFRGIATFWERHHAPDDVRRMLRFQALACRLLLALGPVQRTLSRRWPALDASRLRGRLAVSRERLAVAPPAAHRLAEVPLAIALRQVSLLASWLAHGAAPLDDF